MSRVRVSVGAVFLVLYIEFGKARVGSCAELLGCVVGNCAELLGRCLELHSLICAFECLERHSCSAELCRSCAHWELCRVVGARFGVALLERCLELHSLIECLEMHSCNAELCRSYAHWVVGAMFGVAFLDVCI